MSPDIERICERLVLMNRLYPNYRVHSRGPQGLIGDVLREVWPELALTVDEIGWDAAYRLYFDSETGQAKIRHPYARRIHTRLEILIVAVSSLICALSMIGLSYVVWHGGFR